MFTLIKRRTVGVLTASAVGVAWTTWLLTGASGSATPASVVSVLTAACQPSGQPISVEIDPPSFEPTAVLPWSSHSLRLSGIAEPCVGHRYQLSVADPDGWRPARLGPITGSAISIPMPSFTGSAPAVALAILPPGDDAGLG